MKTASCFRNDVLKYVLPQWDRGPTSSTSSFCLLSPYICPVLYALPNFKRKPFSLLPHCRAIHAGGEMKMWSDRARDDVGAIRGCLSMPQNGRLYHRNLTVASRKYRCMFSPRASPTLTRRRIRGRVVHAKLTTSIG